MELFSIGVYWAELICELLLIRQIAACKIAARFAQDFQMDPPQWLKIYAPSF